MSTDWIPMKLDLHDEPEVVSIASALFGLAPSVHDRDTVVGKLHRIWSWASEHLTDGACEKCSYRFVDSYLQTPGFADALETVGWLEKTHNGRGIRFTKWENWLSESAKMRAGNRLRMRAYRAAQRGEHGRFVPTNVGYGVTTNVPEQVNKKKNPPLPPLPGGEPSSAARKEPAAPGKPEGRKARKARAEAESLRFATAQLTYEFPRGLGNGTRQELAEAGELTPAELAAPPPRRVQP